MTLREQIIDAMHVIKFSTGRVLYAVEWDKQSYQAKDTHDLVEMVLADAIKYKFVAVDRLGKVIGFSSKESDAKDMARRGHTMDSPSKGKGIVGRNSGVVHKLKKPMEPKVGDMMINRPFNQEVELPLYVENDKVILLDDRRG